MAVRMAIIGLLWALSGPLAASAPTPPSLTTVTDTPLSTPVIGRLDDPLNPPVLQPPRKPHKYRNPRQITPEEQMDPAYLEHLPKLPLKEDSFAVSDRPGTNAHVRRKDCDPPSAPDAQSEARDELADAGTEHQMALP
ncbi:MAG: hypothetical protein M1823_000858 [Watsoniomyces obsoletus]|nr:MAG: hypothetical protein M1823_000858 [Watsoniomyces obsoletus]